MISNPIREVLLMYKQIARMTSRFLFNFTLFAGASAHTLLIAVPEASRPGIVGASIAAALLIAMYDIGVFHVDIDTDLI